MSRSAILTIFVLGVSVLLSILGLLERLGLPADLVVRILFLLILACLLFAGLRARSMQSSALFLDNHRMTPLPNGVAMAIIGVGAFGYVMWPGLIYQDGLDGLWHPLGLLVGIAFLGLFMAPHIRRVVVLTPLDLLHQRYNSRMILLGALLVSVPSVFLILLANLSFLADLSHRYTTIAPETALLVVLGAIVLPLLAGGGRAASWLQITMGVLALFGFALPLVWLSFVLTGLPLPHISAFGAFDVIAALEADALAQGWAKPGASGFLTRMYLSFSDAMLVLFGAAFGILGFTPLIARLLSTETPGQSSVSVNWAVLLLGICLVSLPLYAVFLYLQTSDGLNGMTVEAATRSLPILVSGVEGISLCGVVANSPAEAITACGRGHVLVATDLNLAPQSFLSVLPGLVQAFGTELPQTVSAMLACGALAALIALSAACMIGLSQNIAYDFYGKCFAPRAPMNRINFLVRLAVLLVAAMVYFALQTPFGRTVAAAPGEALAIGLALGAGGVMPLFVLGIWSRRVNSLSALFTWISGTGLTLSLLLVSDSALIQQLWSDVAAPGVWIRGIGGWPPLACGVPGAAVAILVGFTLGQILPSQRDNQVFDQMSPKSTSI